jgi:hypothetical protein
MMRCLYIQQEIILSHSIFKLSNLTSVIKVYRCIVHILEGTNSSFSTRQYQLCHLLLQPDVHDRNTHDLVPVAVFVLLAKVFIVVIVGLQAPLLANLHVFDRERVAEARRHIANVLGSSTMTHATGLLDPLWLGAVVRRVIAGLLAVSAESELVATIVEMSNSTENLSIDVCSPVPVNLILVCNTG